MSGRYQKNAGAVFSLKYHVVWCPKYRRPVLEDEIALRLKNLITEKAESIGLSIHALEIMPDHVHLFVEGDPTQCVAEIINQLKGYTSRRLREEFSRLRTRLPTLWNRSYYAGSVGHVRATTIEKYIASQKGK